MKIIEDVLATYPNNILRNITIIPDYNLVFSAEM